MYGREVSLVPGQVTSEAYWKSGESTGVVMPLGVLGNCFVVRKSVMFKDCLVDQSKCT